MERIKRLARPIGWWEIIIYFYLNKKPMFTRVNIGF